ncbi:putative methyl halide transferase [Dioscorea sansibarensis]
MLRSVLVQRCILTAFLVPRNRRWRRSSAGEFSGGLMAMARMGSRGGDDDRKRSKDLVSNPKVVELRRALVDGWEKCWEEGLTPWDLGQPTPIFAHLLQTGNLPKGRVFIPGCGSGYDVVAIAGPERYVVGLDISHTAIKKAKKLSSSLPNASYCTFEVADFFTYQPSELFDLIIDYTFFCALDPSMRPAWANQIGDLSKPDGELLTLMFPIGDETGGPPYSVSVPAYEKLLNPIGFKLISVVDNELAIEPRKGREKLGRWKKVHGKSSL